MSKKPGRNDPCQCGSGKKYKRCCLPGDEAATREHARSQGLFADGLLPGDADFDEDNDFEESFESEEDMLELDVRTITSVCYTRGFVDGSADLAAGRDLRVTEWAAPRIPREVLEILEREFLPALEGEWGDPKAGDLIQVDVIDLETDTDIICIEVFNRAILLSHTDAGEAQRIHGVCEVLEAASEQGIDRSADSSETARAATVTRRARAASAPAFDLSGILKEHRRQGGTCVLCGEAISRGAARKHAARCAPTYDEPDGTAQPLMQVRAVAPGLPAYWLDVEVRADARLEALDSFLRGVWLECCGHMSAFTIGVVRYFSRGYDFSAGRAFAALGGRRSVERSMNTRLCEALPRIGERFRDQVRLRVDDHPRAERGRRTPWTDWPRAGTVAREEHAPRVAVRVLRTTGEHRLRVLLSGWTGRLRM